MPPPDLLSLTDPELLAAYADADDQDAFLLELGRQELDRESRLNGPHALAQAAAWYARAGVALFPCEVGGKRPATAHGFKDATCDPDQVAAWWTAMPQANIGLPTGHLFDVIDVDGPEGSQSIADQWDHFAAIAIGIAKTGRGWHLFIPPTGQGNGTRLMPGVDYRGLGGYVVAPPSRHSGGDRYRWFRPLAVAR